MKLEKPCKLWTGTKNEDGYGIRKGWDGDRRINIRIHREACLAAHGKPPRGKDQVRHLCNVRACYEPTHLAWGDRWDNVQDCVQARRHAFGEKNGRSKLNAKMVASIMEFKDKRNKNTRKGLAWLYGITPQTVSKIWLGQLWSHL
jgi:hypothetical protein